MENSKTNSANSANRVNAYRKGANSERELAEILTGLLGVPIRRQARPYLPGFSNPDVAGARGLHFEAKNRQRLSLRAALEQAQADAQGSVPVVCHRSNHTTWLVTIQLQDLPRLVEAVVKLKDGRPPNKYNNLVP